MNKLSTKRLVLAGFFMTLCLIMPFLTAQIPALGSSLLPMHLPVLLCGYICGWHYGLAVGFISPLLRSILFTMPPMIPVAVSMAFELAVYGFMTGFLYRVFPKKNAYVYISLIISMLCGRIIMGGANLILLGLNNKAYTFAFFITDAFINAIPGIIIQLVLVPLIVIKLKNYLK